MTSGVVTRRPPLNSLSSPTRSSIALICGPPPCTTTGRRPAYRRKATSSAKAALRSSSTMALPPYLTTTSAPRNRSSHGSASTSVEALPAATRIAAASMSPRADGWLGDGKDGAARGDGRVSLMCCRPSSRGRSRGSGRWSRRSPPRRRRGGRRATCTSRAVRSTSARSSPTPPARQTWTPFIVTSRAAGSKAARVVPTAARTRPQLGSLPKIAHLKRLLRATARADLERVVDARRADAPRWRCRGRRPRRRR